MNTEYQDRIVCPYCGIGQSTEIVYDYVTYWGEDEEKEAICENCDKVFIVKEYVIRNWTTTKKESVQELVKVVIDRLDENSETNATPGYVD